MTARSNCATRCCAPWRHALQAGFMVAVALVFFGPPQIARAQDDAAIRTPRVTVTTVTRDEIVQIVPVSGSLLPRREILIYPQVSGFVVDEILADVGDTVARGDVLARVDARTLQAQLAQAQAEEARAQASVRQAQSQIASAEASQAQADAALTRAQELNRTGTVSGAGLEDAVAAARTAEAAAESARDGLAVSQAGVLQAAAQTLIAALNLEHAQIVAPSDGLISVRNGQTGAITAMSGDPFFRLIENGVIELEAEVIETALGQISVGNSVRLNIAGVGAVDGNVRLVSPTVDPATRLGNIRISTPAQDGLRGGVFASAEVIVDRHTGLGVLATAVQTSGDETYVLQVRDGILQRQPVVAGVLWQNRREILSGLSEGDVVVARAAAFFGDGDTVIAVPLELPFGATSEAGK